MKTIWAHYLKYQLYQINMINNYFSIDKFANPKISCGFFTRKNGFSQNNFASLNCSYNSGDDNDIVFKNIEQA